MRDIVENSENYGINSEVLSLVTDAFLQILFRKNPENSGVTEQKCDQMSIKVKLVIAPENINEEDVIEEVEKEDEEGNIQKV